MNNGVHPLLRNSISSKDSILVRKKRFPSNSDCVEHLPPPPDRIPLNWPGFIQMYFISRLDNPPGLTPRAKTDVFRAKIYRASSGRFFPPAKGRYPRRRQSARQKERKPGPHNGSIPLSDLITRDIGAAALAVSPDRVTNNPRRDTIIRSIVLDNAAREKKRGPMI